jgi:ADP-ribose pyrophosphatase
MGKEGHKIAWEGRYLRVRICDNWEYAERPNSPAGIVIVAVTEEDRILLTEQYRVPLQKNVIELPAGLSGDEGDEEFVEAARRELLEETGYEAEEWQELASGPTSAGFCNEIVVFYRGRRLKKVSEGGGCNGESIQVHEVPLPEVHKWLCDKEKSGVVIDPRIYAGLYFALREK